MKSSDKNLEMNWWWKENRKLMTDEQRKFIAPLISEVAQLRNEKKNMDQVLLNGGHLIDRVMEKTNHLHLGDKIIVAVQNIIDLRKDIELSKKECADLLSAAVLAEEQRKNQRALICELQDLAAERHKLLSCACAALIVVSFTLIAFCIFRLVGGIH